MRPVRVVIRDESYMTLDLVAECYDLDLEWVERVYRLGLLGSCEQVEGRPAIPSRMLERVAEVRRLCHYHGLDPLLVDVLFADD
jgi:hypothetical protein